MKKTQKFLLILDGAVNLLLGILLMLFPAGIIELLGLPGTNTNFYPSILGAVLFGIGLALLAELSGYAKHFRGLGLGGAILINFAGSVVLIIWLLSGSLSIPLRGQIILWTVGAVVFIIGFVEAVTKSWRDINNEE